MEQLFEAFKGVSADKWKAQLEKDLKGTTFEQLSRQDANGFTIDPFYAQDTTQVSDSAALFHHTQWAIMQAIKVTDAVVANKLALAQLNDGVSGLVFQVNATVAIEALLKDIELAYIPVRFEVEGDVAQFYTALNEYVQRLGLDLSKLSLFVHTTQQNFTLLGNTLSIAGQQFNNSGANSVTELSAIVGILQEALHQAAANNTLQQIHHLYIDIALDTLFYEQIAKVRALNILIHNVLKAYQIQPILFLHGYTSNIYRSHVDMHSNMLRDTLSAMSAILGGVHGVTVYPFDYYVNEPSSFSYRMAKNVQLILREESYLHLIGDASAGSYYIETLTKELANAAWQQFKQMETQGGWEAYQPQLAAAIAHQAQSLIAAYKEGKKILIGVNNYNNNMEVSGVTFNAAQVSIPEQYINIAQELS